MTSLMLAALLGNAHAAAPDYFESEPQDIFFTDTYNVFAFANFDSGWLPSNSPVQVKFYVDNTGGIVSEFDAISYVAWPDPLTHLISGVPGSGYFGIDSTTVIGADIYIDISIWSGSFTIWNESVNLFKTTTFDPLLLGGNTASVQMAGTSLFPTYQTSYAPVTGITLVFKVDITPTLTATLSGDRIDTTSEGGTAAMTAIGQTHVVPVPSLNPGWVDLLSIYYAQVSSVFDIVVTPAVDVDTIIGGFPLLSFDIPINIVDYDQTWDFEPVEYSHPLPSALMLLEEYDFSEVDLDNLSNLQVPFRNVGQLELEGWARIEPPGDISVFPTYLYAAPGETDGVVVTFGPSVAEDVAADLIIETNDPLQPEIIIPLIGSGFDPDAIVEDPDDTGIVVDDTDGGGLLIEGDSEKSKVSTCGCVASGSSPALPWLLLSGLALLIRRRRS